jgi:hypothetical protein
MKPNNAIHTQNVEESLPTACGRIQSHALLTYLMDRNDFVLIFLSAFHGSPFLVSLPFIYPIFPAFFSLCFLCRELHSVMSLGLLSKLPVLLATLS